MKNLLLGSLSVLLISAAVPNAVKAEPFAVNSRTFSRTSTSTTEVQPFNLVYLAYQGYFSAQGIPSSQALIAAYESQRVTPEDLVQCAINTNRLSSNALNDESYLNAVDSTLRELVTQGR